MISLKNINKRYIGRNFNVYALKNLSMEVKKSEFVSIIGKSGSGKSTLIKIMGLLDRDFEGEYSLYGNNIKLENDNGISMLRRNIGFIFQDFQLISRYTVYKNVEISYIIKYKKTNRAKILEVIESVGLLDKIDSFPDELSGGQKQRVSIARALVNDPDLIIADEPTGALDEMTSKEILDLLIDINKLGKTIVLVTHDIDIAKKANRIIKIVNGEVVS